MFCSPLQLLLPFSVLELSLIHLLPNALGTACLVLVRIFTHMEMKESCLVWVGPGNKADPACAMVCFTDVLATGSNRLDPGVKNRPGLKTDT